MHVGAAIPVASTVCGKLGCFPFTVTKILYQMERPLCYLGEKCCLSSKLAVSLVVHKTPQRTEFVFIVLQTPL